MQHPGSYTAVPGKTPIWIGCMPLRTWIINPLTALFLRGIGIVKCTFTVPVGLIAASGVGLVFFTFGIACLLSVKIRKIAPVALLSGE